MKRCIFLFAALSLVLTSCGGRSQDRAEQSSEETDEPGIMDAVSGIRQLSKAADRMGDIEALQKKLQETAPVERDVLRSAIPETLLGLKRSKLTLGEGQLLNLNSGSAEYTDEEGTRKISLSITDGAGETGSAVVLTSLYTLSMDIEEETNDGFKRTGELGGYRASFQQSKDYDGNPESEIAVLVDSRFLVSLSGEHMDVETLKGALDGIALDKLKD